MQALRDAGVADDSKLPQDLQGMTSCLPLTMLRLDYEDTFGCKLIYQELGCGKLSALLKKECADMISLRTGTLIFEVRSNAVLVHDKIRTSRPMRLKSLGVVIYMPTPGLWARCTLLVHISEAGVHLIPMYVGSVGSLVPWFLCGRTCA